MPPKMWAGVNDVSSGPRTSVCLNDQAPWIRRIVEDTLTHCRDQEAIIIVGGWAYREAEGNISDRGREVPLVPWTPHLANQCEQIIKDWRRAGGRDENLWLEFGNEIDITAGWKRNLDAFHRAAMVCYERVRSLSGLVRYVTGSTSNFRKRKLPWQSPKGYEVQKRLSKMDWPVDTYQGMHPYRDDPSSFRWEAFERMLGKRKAAITEMGWASGEGHTDEAIAQFVDDEIRKWEQFGAACYDHYQIGDGAIPYNTGPEGFGAYTALDDGFEPKPVQPVLENWKAEL